VVFLACLDHYCDVGMSALALRSAGSVALLVFGLPLIVGFGTVPPKKLNAAPSPSPCENVPVQVGRGIVDCCEIHILVSDNPAGNFEVAQCTAEGAADPYVLPHDDDFAAFEDGTKLKVLLEPTTSPKPLGDGALWTVVEVISVLPSRTSYTNPSLLPATDPRSALAVYAKYADAAADTADSCTRSRFEEAAFGASPPGWAHIINATTFGITTFSPEDYQWVEVTMEGTFTTSVCSWSSDSQTGQYGLTYAIEAQVEAVHGLRAADFHHTLFITPENWCGRSGQGIAGHGGGCSNARAAGQSGVGYPCRTWYYGGYGCGSLVVAHELGHNFWFHHAGAPSSWSGTPTEYGDSISIMGSHSNFDADFAVSNKKLGGLVPYSSIYNYAAAEGRVAAQLIRQSAPPDASRGYTMVALPCEDAQEDDCLQSFDSPWSDDPVLKYGSSLSLAWYSVPGSMEVSDDFNHKVVLQLVYDNNRGTYRKAMLEIGQTYQYGANGMYSLRMCEDPTAATLPTDEDAVCTNVGTAEYWCTASEADCD